MANNDFLILGAAAAAVFFLTKNSTSETISPQIAAAPIYDLPSISIKQPATIRTIAPIKDTPAETIITPKSSITSQKINTSKGKVSSVSTTITTPTTSNLSVMKAQVLSLKPSSFAGSPVVSPGSIKAVQTFYKKVIK